MGEAGDGAGSVPKSLTVGVCKGILTWQVTYGLGSLGYRESRRWGRAMDGRRLKTSNPMQVDQPRDARVPFVSAHAPP